jgi:hypothetical protein
MAKNVRLGIIRARHDTTVPVISDAACIAMFMTGEHALLKYWINTSRGYLDFIDSPLFPWVDMSIGADTGRVAQAKAAIDALRARYPGHDPLAGLDALVSLAPGNQGHGKPAGRAAWTASHDHGRLRRRRRHRRGISSCGPPRNAKRSHVHVS